MMMQNDDEQKKPQEGGRQVSGKKPEADRPNDSVYRWDYAAYDQMRRKNEGGENNNYSWARRIIVLVCILITLFACYGIYHAISSYGRQDKAPVSPEISEEASVPQVIIDGALPPAINDDKTLSVPRLAQQVRPSVVAVVQYRKSQQLEPSMEGSGIIMSEDGYIITNHHLVERADGIKVVLDNGEIYEARVIGSDRLTDLAVIKITANNLIGAQFGVSSQLIVGQWVVSVGSAQTPSSAGGVTFGVVSAKNKLASTQAGISIDCIQTDAVINPASSGGALVNSRGQVVGINCTDLESSGKQNAQSGAYFAISIDQAKRIVNDLIESGYVTGRAKIGVSVQPVDEVMVSIYHVPRGLHITRVDSGSEMDQKDVRSGDIITAIDNVPVTTNEDLASILYNHQPGDRISLTICRPDTYGNPENMNVTITLTEDVPAKKAS